MNPNIIIAICYYAVFLAQFWVMWKEKEPKENEIFSVTIPDAVMEREEILNLRKTYTRTLTAAGILTAVLPLSLLIAEWKSVQALLWMIFFVLLVCCSYFPYIRANKKLKTLKEQNHDMTGAAGLEEIDGYWRMGLFYNNPQDKRLRAEKKVGIGTCINHGRTFGKMLTVLAIAALAAVLGLGIHMVRLQSVPITLSYKEGVLEAGQTRANYHLEADVMQMMMMLDSFPASDRVIGLEMDNLYRGIYRVEGIGNCKVNVNPKNHAFILIYAEDGCYIFSADTDKKTQEVYHKLKEEL